MSTHNLHTFAIAAALSSLVSGGLIVACSSNSSNPTPIVYTLHPDGGDAAHAAEAATTSPDAGSDALQDVTTQSHADADAAQNNPVPDSQAPDSHVTTTQDAPVADSHPHDAGVDDASTEDAAKPKDAGCAGDGGCWRCTPTTTAEFLNQCTTAQCTPFNNFQRLPDYDGSLPPLN